MATTDLKGVNAPVAEPVWAESLRPATVGLSGVITALASLRLTVVLFALMIFLVFAGTLAQKDHGIWYVVDHAYFRVWIATVELRAFEGLTQMFYPAADWGALADLKFFFPGGYLIGTIMAVNLAAAHYARFRVAAKGTRLWGGWAIIAAGVALTFLIIRSGMDNALESELSPFFCNVIWHSFRALTAGLALTGAYVLMLTYGRIRRVEWLVLLTLVVLVAAVAAWLFLNPDVRLDASGLRILWQLAKGTIAGGVLLAGCIVVFARRAGIVLLHGGIGLLMFSELWTGLVSDEASMTIYEGQTANYAYDIRSTELAIIDRHSDDQEEIVTVVPEAQLTAAARKGTAISHEFLPFDLVVRDYFVNSRLREPRPDDTNPANQGAGKFTIAEPIAKVSGVSTSGEVDQPSLYVELQSKEGQSLGTYLLSAAGFEIVDGTGPPRTVYLPEQPVEIDGKAYDLSLRFERHYKPYSISLIDFSFDRYTATNTAKNFSSRVRLQDAENNVDREVLIWMNNPLRYAGETFYQSSYDDQTEQATVLQVVKNPGWMIPYVACMLVATGMIAHFGIALSRFVRRRAEGRDVPKSVAADSESALRFTLGRRHSGWAMIGFPLAVVVVWAGYVSSKARTPHLPAHAMQIHEFGKMPVAYQGRIQPIDTVARNTLQILSGRQTVIVPEKEPPRGLSKLLHRPKKLPAVRWLLDTIAGAPGFDQHRVFRIDNLDLLAALDLEHRPGSFRYSLADLRRKLPVLDKQTALALESAPEQRSLFQRKVLELADKLQKYSLLIQSFSSPQISSEGQEILNDFQRVQAEIAALKEGIRGRRQLKLVMAVPPTDPAGEWTFLLDAEFEVLKNQVLGRDVNPATISFATLLKAYAQGDARTFNTELPKYRELLARYEESVDQNQLAVQEGGLARAEILSLNKVGFESFFNQFSPFYYAAVLYLVAFVLAVLAWLGWWAPLNRAANWLLQFTLLLHTFALIARIYISGRPPVTNLYSSAVFIGWGCVVLALILEAIYRLGIGNILASVAGFLTLVIAYNLSLDGDTFVVLQAVLDTQFWLATHVVCITLGYSTTFLAGLLGVIYIVLHHVAGKLDSHARQQITRMIYGTLCFAIFFSFVGTVLGGLWADDSWGRFWGWDPKENGALIIVLWNALVLHARWSAMVGPRGLANLAIGGNIVTAWSWFGVNELGVGLHAYGASETSTALWLLGFAISQLAVIAVGLLPVDAFRGRTTSAAA